MFFLTNSLKKYHIRLSRKKNPYIFIFYIQTLGYNMSYLTFQFLELANKFSYNIFFLHCSKYSRDNGKARYIVKSHLAVKQV